MMPHAAPRSSLRHLDDATVALVRLSAIVAASSEQEIRDAMARARDQIPVEWVEELLLQTYLFAGFPRALNAMREWRRLQGNAATGMPDGEPADDVDRWRADGMKTCAAVYGSMYDRLRDNVRALHPLLDEWMITEGYGKVLSRPGLDLPRRELCIVAACAASAQERQLHSHLHGAMNVGVEPGVIDDAIEALAPLLGVDRAQSLRLLWARVRRVGGGK